MSEKDSITRGTSHGVLASANPSPPPRLDEHRRRTERVLLRIPIEVEGSRVDGKPFREKTTTLVINRHGALISLKAPVRSQELVTITNMQTALSCPFRVVGGREQSFGEGPECGVECLKPEINFWGISFPERVEAPRKKEVISTLLECSRCHACELSQMTLEQYYLAVRRSSLSRYCAKCGGTTGWGFGLIETESDGAPPDQPTGEASTSAPGQGMEQRRAQRLTIKLPARICLEDGREEVTHTENLSKGGACFVSDVVMEVGQRIRISIGGAPDAGQPGAMARVVWRQGVTGNARMTYGVELEEKRLTALEPLLRADR